MAFVTRMPTYMKEAWTRVPARVPGPLAGLAQPEFRALGDREGKPSPGSDILLSLPNSQ